MRYVHVTGVPTCALPISGPDNPYLHDHDHLRWPMDILGDRGAQIADGAQLVQAATDLEKVAAAVGVGAAEVEVGEQEWSDEIDALLAERQRSREPGPVTVELPENLSVTALVALRDRKSTRLNS